METLVVEVIGIAEGSVVAAAGTHCELSVYSTFVGAGVGAECYSESNLQFARDEF
jgi:hypothetical protein